MKPANESDDRMVVSFLRRYFRTQQKDRYAEQLAQQYGITRPGSTPPRTARRPVLRYLAAAAAVAGLLFFASWAMNGFDDTPAEGEFLVVAGSNRLVPGLPVRVAK